MQKLLNLCVVFRRNVIFHSFFRSSLPISITGGVGAMVQKELTFCGGLRTSSSASTASKDSYASECYKWTSEGWQRHKSMTKPRAFAASAWVITSPYQGQKRPKKLKSVQVVQNWFFLVHFHPFRRENSNNCTVFENHRKSRILLCERSELRLHLSKMPKMVHFGKFLKT